MKNYTLAIIVALIIAILLVAVGFASINSAKLTVSGNAVATTDQNNFKVKFTNSVSTTGTTVTSITSDTTATMDVSGLTTVGDEASATFTIQNASEDLDAVNVAADVTSESNTDYFEVTESVADTTIDANGDITTMTVNVKLKKTPINDVTGSFTVELTADPVEN